MTTSWIIGLGLLLKYFIWVLPLDIKGLRRKRAEPLQRASEVKGSGTQATQTVAEQRRAGRAGPFSLVSARCWAQLPMRQEEASVWCGLLLGVVLRVCGPPSPIYWPPAAAGFLFVFSYGSNKSSLKEGYKQGKRALSVLPVS